MPYSLILEDLMMKLKKLYIQYDKYNQNRFLVLALKLLGMQHSFITNGLKIEKNVSIDSFQ